MRKKYLQLILGMVRHKESIQVLWKYNQGGGEEINSS